MLVPVLTKADSDIVDVPNQTTTKSSNIQNQCE